MQCERTIVCFQTELNNSTEMQRFFSGTQLVVFALFGSNCYTTCFNCREIVETLFVAPNDHQLQTHRKNPFSPHDLFMDFKRVFRLKKCQLCATQMVS